MSKTRKPRRLWTKIRGTVPPGTGAAEFWGLFRKAVRERDYQLPDDWDVSIEWKNKEQADFKSGAFTEAMQESAESSRGWDRVILGYINRQIAKLPELGKVPGKLRARTRRVRFVKRSKAAVKGWRTRRAAARLRSAAARNGWRTRRHNAARKRQRRKKGRA